MFASPTMEPLNLRLSLSGLSGSGKTYSALTLATALGGRIAVVDTERGSAKRYHRPRGPFEFQVVELEEFAPQRYVDAIRAAAEARFDVLVVDSMSHAWDGLLDQVGGGGKQGWGKVRPVEREFWSALLTFPGHLIATFRVRSAFAEVEDGKGRPKQQKVGLEAVQRQGTEYEFDICLRLEEEGEVCVVEKTRCSTISGKRFSRPGANIITAIRPWLDAGTRGDPVEVKALGDAIRALVAHAPFRAAVERDVAAAGSDLARLARIKAEAEAALVPPAPAADPSPSPSSAPGSSGGSDPVPQAAATAPAGPPAAAGPASGSPAPSSAPSSTSTPGAAPAAGPPAGKPSDDRAESQRLLAESKELLARAPDSWRGKAEVEVQDAPSLAALREVLARIRKALEPKAPPASAAAAPSSSPPAPKAPAPGPSNRARSGAPAFGGGAR